MSFEGLYCTAGSERMVSADCFHSQESKILDRIVCSRLLSGRSAARLNLFGPGDSTGSLNSWNSSIDVGFAWKVWAESRSFRRGRWEHDDGLQDPRRRQKATGASP